MDAFDGSLSDLEEESQATQLIHEALEQSPEPFRPTKETSIASYPSSRNSASNTVHQYHFHGLATTQTQTQLCEEEGSINNSVIPSGGPQREIFMAGVGRKTGKDAKWGVASHGPSLKRGTAMDGRSGQPPGPATKSSSGPATTFQPPTKSPHPPSAMHKTNSHYPPQRITRSHSPDLSQDSFAQGDSQLDEEKFLVTSKKFTMPLSDLARGAELSDEDQPSKASSRRSKVTQSRSSSQAAIRGEDDPPPVILVPSTPSQSESSENSRDESSQGNLLPQADLDSFEQGQDTRMIVDNDSSKSSEPSQGFDDQEAVAEVQDLYSNKSRRFGDPHLPSNVRATPAFSSQQATQVASQDEPYSRMQVSSSGVSTMHLSTYTGPRSLLDSMNPHKRGRYQHLVQYTPGSPTSPLPQQFPAGPVKLSKGWEETQPSEPTQSNTIPPQPFRAAPPLRKMSPERPVQRELPAPLSTDATDIVPDSEPLQERTSLSIAEEQYFPEGNRETPLQRDRHFERIQSNDSEATEDSDVLPQKFVTQEGAQGEGRVNQAKKEEEEEEEEGRTKEVDDDDDVPLSARLPRNKGKVPVMNSGRRGSSHTYHSRVKVDGKTEIARSAADAKQVIQTLPHQGVHKTSNPKPRAAGSPHESTVPSSVPDQDHVRSARLRKPSLKAATALMNKGRQSTRKAATRATSVTTSIRSPHSATVEAEGDPDEGASDSERATEPAIEDEDEDYMEPEIPQQNLKRKRGRPPKSKSMSHATTTPRTRNTKRLKSAGSTMSRMDATRVFALWKQNNLWYSGIVYEHIAGTMYSIRFDDDTEAAVDIENIRSFSLRIGDLVRIDKKAKDHKVVKVNHRTMKVDADVGGDVKECHIGDISISTKIINVMWQDRTIDSRTIVPATKEVDVKLSPSPSRSATSLHSLGVKGPPRSLNKFLQKVGLVVSLSGNNTNDKTKDGRTRSDILNAVRNSGGVVVDDLFKYLKMDISYSTNRWVIERTDVKWIGEPKELQRLFLLADDCNLKPKYLMALALGIPCLSVNWLYDCLEAGKELDWRSQILPQGRPTSFDVLPSQQIDLSWGSHLDHLSDIMSNPIAPKILDGKFVLCVGPDMTPKNKDTDKASEAANYIMRIIIAMGATKVESVRHVDYAANPLSQYHLLVIREKEQFTRDYVQTNTVDWNWVKDSLIMSRMLPYPTWTIEDDSQCSQSL